VIHLAAPRKDSPPSCRSGPFFHEQERRPFDNAPNDGAFAEVDMRFSLGTGRESFKAVSIAEIVVRPRFSLQHGMRQFSFFR